MRQLFPRAPHCGHCVWLLPANSIRYNLVKSCSPLSYRRWRSWTWAPYGTPEQESLQSNQRYVCVLPSLCWMTTLIMRYCSAGSWLAGWREQRVSARSSGLGLFTTSPFDQKNRCSIVAAVIKRVCLCARATRACLVLPLTVHRWRSTNEPADRLALRQEVIQPATVGEEVVEWASIQTRRRNSPSRVAPVQALPSRHVRSILSLNKNSFGAAGV